MSESEHIAPIHEVGAGEVFHLLGLVDGEYNVTVLGLAGAGGAEPHTHAEVNQSEVLAVSLLKPPGRVSEETGITKHEPARFLGRSPFVVAGDYGDKFLNTDALELLYAPFTLKVRRNYLIQNVPLCPLAHIFAHISEYDGIMPFLLDIFYDLLPAL